MKKHTKARFLTTVLFCLFAALSVNTIYSQTTTYNTIANGNWSSASTWQGGNIPPTGSDIPASTIINIRHNVAYNTGNPIKNRGTIRIEPTTGTTARLNVPTAINVENYAASPRGFYVINGSFIQCRFTLCNDGEPYSGNNPGAPKQSGSLKNLGGYNEVRFSNIEIAQDWTNESGGTRIVEDSCVKTGQNFSLSGSGSVDTLTRTSISIGWHTSGNFQVADGTATYQQLKAQLAGTSGSFQLSSGTVNGSIDYIALRNHIVPFTGGGEIFASSSVNTTGGINLNAYCVSAPSKYIPNGKFTGAQTSGCAMAITCAAGANVSLSGNVFNDVNGLTDSIVNGAGTNTGGTIYVNLLNNGGTVVQTMLVPASGIYSFANVSSGGYTVQVSTNQGIIGNAAPATALPPGWVNTGENVGAGAGNDGTTNGLLPVTVAAAAVTDANFGIEQRPTANDNTAASQVNPGGTTNAIVPATTFTATDVAPGTVASIRITAFPSNATTITINGTQYTSATFPTGGVIVPTNAAGNPTQPITVDPIDGAVTVGIPYQAIDNAGVESLAAATASVPFTLAPTAANANISGTLYFGKTTIRNALVVLIDTVSNSKSFVRTDAGGKYLFEEKAVGRTYIVQPLSNKYSFSPATRVVSLVDDALELNFNSAAKTYRPKNDFDGDGTSDVAVFRPADGNWYVLRSSDAQMSVFNFGADADIPISADFDGDGKTDYAVFRPSEGIWYIWQSNTQDLRAERFGAADDKLVPADYDGDGKADVAVFRNGIWYIRRSSDGSFESRNYGADADTPVTGDFDGDGKSDFSVFRPAAETWFTLNSSNNNSLAARFGLATDVPVAGDFDGDGFADIAQFRNGFWYVLGSTTGFEASRCGAGEDRPVVGDYDGDGRVDTTVFRDGLWSIRDSGSGAVRNIYFGLPTDILIK